MSAEFDAVVEAVRERVTPDADERERLETVARRVRERAEAAVEDMEVAATVERVGSTARSTWTAGDHDLDIFVRFPPALDRDSLESLGLTVGYEAIPDGHEEYAEHPYVTGTVDGFDVDLVPCYDVDSAAEAQSAVDRTPFHTRYVADRLDEAIAGDVRVAKAFCRAAGVYGSDLRTRGFSGYLLELLVLEYGGFRELIDAAAEWHPPVEIDPVGHGAQSFEDPLVVIDPTDPERNVAAVVTAESVAHLQHHARALRSDPSRDAFAAREPDPLDAAAVRQAIETRETTPLAIRFDPPDLVADQLWPQLERSRRGIMGELDRRGFDVLRSAAFADEQAVLFFELAVATRPAIERHVGPPVHVADHASSFLETYADSAVAGPFIEDDRYVVERERTDTHAGEWARSEALFDVSLGADIETALETSAEVLVGNDVAELASSFGRDLAAYFDPKP
jgi:tRNA nucleotidyltransferase (CCA-adding enzyme)